MKKILSLKVYNLIIFWLLLLISNSFSFSNESKTTYGIETKKADLNLNCKSNRSDSNKRIGFKNISSKDNSEQILVRLTKYKDGLYSFPESKVFDYVAYEYDGISYDKMQMSFDHILSSKKYYLFRNTLLTKGEEYILSESAIAIDKKKYKKLNSYLGPLDDIIRYNKNVDDYIKKITDYSNLTLEYMLANVRDNLLWTNVYKCKKY